MESKRSIVGAILVLCVFVAFHAVPPAVDAADTDTMRIGVAEVEITPTIGDAHYRGASTGVADPLWAKAVVFRQGDQQAALVFCDVIAVSFDQSDAARNLTAEKTGIPSAHICIAATHTHTGRLSDKSTEESIKRIARAVTDAQAVAVPVKLQTATGQQEGLSFNRRFLMRDGSVRMNPGFRNPDIVRPVGPIDPDVNVLFVRRAADDGPLAAVTVFAMHLDTVGGTEYSADYPYFLQQNLREQLGEDFHCLFGTGTCGDVNHFDVAKSGPQKGHQECTKHLGRSLAATVIAQLPRLKDVTRPNLGVRSRTLQVPLQEVSEEELQWASRPDKDRKPLVPERLFLQRFRASKIRSLAAMRKRWGATLPLEVQVFRLGDDLAVVALPGEVFVELGLAVKKASPFETTMVIELANSCPAYVPTRKAFEEGDYEVVNSRVAAGGGEMLVETAAKMLQELKAH